ncbi:DUF6323 family protein [Anaerosacchariphilus polymeriproducens]|uniref:Uncharacterized protein n=1 Tax=Anaerosacchariphilus polymeriproducens TaxID=1812858 RepID=A0A371AYU2_9FIRM|nr:DUF6323 family protein [Anaerosacchariphilus polymeriproducens]RDU24723.1 hypothetical protein DWV06_04445 [Anaerosacchariphilus polymeriproducens]
MNDKMFLRLIGQNEKTQLQTIIACNQYTKKFGLSLTEQDVLVLMNDRKSSLKEQERIEFGEGILPKLIFAFCDSPYIYQENYVDVIGRLQDIFYYYKNESMDELSDDELLDYMKELFDGKCEGSLDYLEETCLEHISREIRAGRQGFTGGDTDEF